MARRRSILERSEWTPAQSLACWVQQRCMAPLLTEKLQQKCCRRLDLGKAAQRWCSRGRSGSCQENLGSAALSRNRRLEVPMLGRLLASKDLSPLKSCRRR